MKTMRIVIWEIRRYLSPKMLVFIAVSLMLWSLMRDPNYRWLDEFDNNAQLYLLSVEYQERFGDSIDLSEQQIIKDDLTKAQQSGLNDRAAAIEEILKHFWLVDDEESSILNACYPFPADSYPDHWLWWEAPLYLLCAVMILFRRVREHHAKVEEQCIASKCGRRIYLLQLAAAVLAAVLLYLVVAVIFYILFAFCDHSLLHLMNSNIALGDFYSDIPTFNITLLEYTLLFFAKTLLVLPCYVCVLYMVSYSVNHFTTAFFGGITLALLNFFWTHKLNYMENVYEDHRILVTPEWLLPFLLIPVSTTIFLMIKQRKKAKQK